MFAGAFLSKLRWRPWWRAGTVQARHKALSCLRRCCCCCCHFQGGIDVAHGYVWLLVAAAIGCCSLVDDEPRSIRRLVQYQSSPPLSTLYRPRRTLCCCLQTLLAQRSLVG